MTGRLVWQASAADHDAFIAQEQKRTRGLYFSHQRDHVSRSGIGKYVSELDLPNPLDARAERQPAVRGRVPVRPAETG